MAASDWAQAAWDETGKPCPVESIDLKKDGRDIKVELYKNYVRIVIDKTYFAEVKYGYLDIYPLELHVTKIPMQRATFVAVFYKGSQGNDRARFWIGCHGYKADDDPYANPPESDNDPVWIGVTEAIKFCFESWLADLWINDFFTNPLMKEGPPALDEMEDKSFGEIKYGSYFRQRKGEKESATVDYLDDEARAARIKRVMEETPDEPLFKQQDQTPEEKI